MRDNRRIHWRAGTSGWRDVSEEAVTERQIMFWSRIEFEDRSKNACESSKFPNRLNGPRYLFYLAQSRTKDDREFLNLSVNNCEQLLNGVNAKEHSLRSALDPGMVKMPPREARSSQFIEVL